MPVILADQTPNIYTQTLDVLNRLPDLLAADRTTRNLTLAQQAGAIGIGTTTLQNIGPNSTGPTITKCLTYLGGLS